MRFLDQVIAGSSAKPNPEPEGAPPLAAFRAVVELRGSLGWKLFLEVVNQQIQGLEATVFTSKDMHEVAGARATAMALATLSQWPERAAEVLKSHLPVPVRNVPTTISQDGQ